MFTKTVNSKQHQRTNQHLLRPCLFIVTRLIFSRLLSLLLSPSNFFSRLSSPSPDYICRLWSNHVDTKVVVSKAHFATALLTRLRTRLRTRLQTKTSPMSPSPSQEGPGSLAPPQRSRLRSGPWACRCECSCDQGHRHCNSDRDAVNHYYYNQPGRGVGKEDKQG